MRKITVGIGILFSLMASAIGSVAYGLSETIVITTAQVRSASSSTDESITLTNNTSGDVDVTNWCLQYASSSNSVEDSSQLSWRNLACVQPTDEKIHIMLPSHQSVVAVSLESGWSGDLTFSATLANTSGHVRLIDADGNEIDRLGWGEARFPESFAVVSPEVGKMMQRLVDDATETFIDSDNNLADFAIVDGVVPVAYGSLYEAEDSCRNIQGFQPTLPDDHVLTNEGDCLVYQDVCANIDGIQLIVPDGYIPNEAGDCQVSCAIADGYVHAEDGSCVLDILPLELSELLPNPIGSDSGNEFIELYNPNDQPVALDRYQLLIGKNYERIVSFPEGLQLAAGEYFVISNADYSFTLLNTTTKLKLVGVDGRTVYEMPVYNNPADGIAWANVDDVWQFTNRPTSGKANLAWYNEPVVSTPTKSAALASCAANQYRNPDTNRCKLIASSTSTSSSCKEGQYRNPETNRCKSLETKTSLAACPEGQERNPETNRCRKIVSSDIPQADYGVLSGQSDEGSSTSYLIITIIVIGVLGVTYAIWEWRADIFKFSKKAWLVVRRIK